MKGGYKFSLEWLLRNVTAVATGRALFSFLSEVSAADFQTALRDSSNHIGTFLDAASGRLGLDHDRVLMGRYATPVITRLLHLNGGGFTDSAHRDKVLFWYVHSALWGRFSGSTETILQQDYDTAARGGVDALITTLERSRGGQLTISPDDFHGSTRGSRFYPLLYLLTRVDSARDFGSGLQLRAELLGKVTSLQVHHIFPKALLRQHGFDRGEINAIANFCFLTQATNIKIGMREPANISPRWRPSTRVCCSPSGSLTTPRCGRSTGTPTSWRPGANCSPGRRKPSSTACATRTPRTTRRPLNRYKSHRRPLTTPAPSNSAA